MRQLAIYGFGGFGRETACLIKHINEISSKWDFVGYFDDGIKIGTTNNYGKVLGGINEVSSWSQDLDLVFAIANSKHIMSITSKIANPYIHYPNIIAPNVHFFDFNNFRIGKGNVISFGARISCDVSLGDFNLLNGTVGIGHDVSIGSYNIVGPGVRFSGDCRIGDCNFFGVESILLQGLRVGENTVIGAGSVVMRSTKDFSTYFGNPAKKLIY